MTLSIVAKDEKTGDFGICGYTDIAGYGSLVPHVSLNGAVATQAYVSVDNGIEIIELLEKKISIIEAGKKVINKDKDRSMRQLIGIDHIGFGSDLCQDQLLSTSDPKFPSF